MSRSGGTEFCPLALELSGELQVDTLTRQHCHAKQTSCDSCSMEQIRLVVVRARSQDKGSRPRVASGGGPWRSCNKLRVPTGNHLFCSCDRESSGTRKHLINRPSSQLSEVRLARDSTWASGRCLGHEREQSFRASEFPCRLVCVMPQKCSGNCTAISLDSRSMHLIESFSALAGRRAIESSPAGIPHDQVDWSRTQARAR